MRKLKSEGREWKEGKRDTGRREGKEERREKGRQVSQMDGPCILHAAPPASACICLPPSPQHTCTCLIVFPTLTSLHSSFREWHCSRPFGVSQPSRCPPDSTLGFCSHALPGLPALVLPLPLAAAAPSTPAL